MLGVFKLNLQANFKSLIVKITLIKNSLLPHTCNESRKPTIQQHAWCTFPATGPESHDVGCIAAAAARNHSAAEQRAEVPHPLKSLCFEHIWERTGRCYYKHLLPTVWWIKTTAGSHLVLSDEAYAYPQSTTADPKSRKRLHTHSVDSSKSVFGCLKYWLLKPMLTLHFLENWVGL